MNKIKTFLKSNIHLLLGLVPALAYFYFFAPLNLDDSKWENIFVATVTVTSIAIGFLATSKSILITIDKKRIIKYLKQSGNYSTLIDQLMRAIEWSFFSAFMSMYGLFTINSTVIEVWIFAFTVAGITYYQTIRLITRILKFSDQPPTEASQGE